MKYKHLGGAALFLAAAMTFTACTSSNLPAGTSTMDETAIQADSGVPDTLPTDENAADNAATGDMSSTAGNTVNAAVSTTNGTAGNTTAVNTAVSTAETVFTFADAFSNRDLAGSYDAAGAVSITLNGSTISCNSNAVTVSGSTATITAAGTYLISGTLENGTIIVDAGKQDKVQLVLDNASIHSDTFAAIYVRQADKVFITLADGTVNTLSNGGTFVDVDDNSVDGVIFSKDDLTLNGSGKLVITSPQNHGVVGKDDLLITGGTYEITAGRHALSGKDSVGIAAGTLTLTAGKDGIHSENNDDAEKGNIYIAGGTLTITAQGDGIQSAGLLQIDGGSVTITGAEGMESTYIQINDGTINIYATDDGINATRKSNVYTPTVEINGGDITVEVGPGDTDGIDTNGNLIITGGAISVTGNSTFDVDGSVTFTGGTVIVNGQQVDTIPNQMMGGRGGMGRNFGGGAGNWNQAGGQMPDGEMPAGQMPGGNRQRPDRSGQMPDGSGASRTREWNGNWDRDDDDFDDRDDDRDDDDDFDDRDDDEFFYQRNARKGRRNQAETPDAVTAPTQKTATI